MNIYKYIWVVTVIQQTVTWRQVTVTQVTWAAGHGDQAVS